jgi:hypothetical protein
MLWELRELLRRVRGLQGKRRGRKWNISRRCWWRWKRLGSSSLWIRREDWLNRLNKKEISLWGLYKHRKKLKNRKGKLKKRRRMYWINIVCSWDHRYRQMRRKVNRIDWIIWKRGGKWDRRYRMRDRKLRKLSIRRWDSWTS